MARHNAILMSIVCLIDTRIMLSTAGLTQHVRQFSRRGHTKCLFIGFVLCHIACLEHSRSNGTGSTETDPTLHELSQLIAQNPQDLDLRWQKAQTLYELSRLKEAENELLHIVDQNPGFEQVWHLLADVQMDDLQSMKALETMEKTVVNFPENTSSQLKLAEFQIILKQFGPARLTLQTFKQHYPNDPDGYFLMGLLMRESGDTLGAIAQLKAATREEPAMVDAWLMLAELLEANADPDVIRYLDAAIAVDPASPAPYMAKAQHLGRNERYEEAKVVYKTLLESNPYHASAYYDLGLILLEQDSIQGARAHFDLAVKTDVTFGRAYFYRAVTAELLEQPQQAVADYQQALRLNPGDPDALERLELLLSDD